MAFLRINDEKVLDNLGFKQFNPLQRQMFKASQKFPDIMLIAPTGSGKTLAFIRCILPDIKIGGGVQVLILAPTRELVLQTETVFRQMKLGIKVNVSYGGHQFSVERNNFIHPPEVLIGTPGRVQDHLNKGTFDPVKIHAVVFDEFDKSLEFGFSTQMENITNYLIGVKRKILVSATKSVKVPAYLNLSDLHLIESASEAQPNIKLSRLVVPADEKLEGLLQLLGALKQNENAIVFVNHREACDRISVFFNRLGIQFSLFHGGLKQEKRELELTKFRNGSTSFLIATDIASRGIDIPELNTVIHYQLPLTETVFIHRNGRTARMKASGESIILQTIGEDLPDYIDVLPDSIPLADGNPISGPDWVTFYVGKGKKDKINKVDLVGYFLQFDFMTKDDLGLIEVKDFTAYIAVKSQKSKKMLKACQSARIKNKAVKIRLAK